ncbi:MAG: TadE/TadG family type IV pilus assembly protein [Anaerolineae bacterium]
MENGRRTGESGQIEMGGQYPFPFSLFPFPLSFLRDRRGAVAVQTFMLLPIFVLVVFGGYEILRLLSVKQALHDGTYQAARYLALNPIMATRSGPWEDVAGTFILQELEAEVGEREARQGLTRVRVTPPGNIPPCGFFKVESLFTWQFDVPFANRFRTTLGEEYRASIVKCY